MQRQVAGDGKDRDEDAQRPYVWPPERLRPESEHGQDRGGRNINLDAELESVSYIGIPELGTDHADLCFLQLQILQLVHREGLVCGVEERACKQPLQRRSEDIFVDQQSGEQQAGERIPVSAAIQMRIRKCSLVQHQQGPGETRNGCAFEHDGDQEHGGSGREVEQNQRQHELPVHRNLRHQTDQAVNDPAEQQGWHDPEWENVEQDLRREIGEGRVVSVGSEDQNF